MANGTELAAFQRNVFQPCNSRLGDRPVVMHSQFGLNSLFDISSVLPRIPSANGIILNNPTVDTITCFPQTSMNALSTNILPPLSSLFGLYLL